jgi:transposase
MPTERIPGKPSTRRYTPAEREQAVRLVRQLHKELRTDQGTVARVAKHLGYGVESVRAWVNQADIDGGLKNGPSTEDAGRINEFEQEIKELRRANEIFRKASAYIAPVICQPRRSSGLPRVWLSPNLTSIYSQEGYAPCQKPFAPSSTLTSSPWPVNGKHRSSRIATDFGRSCAEPTRWPHLLRYRPS